MKISELSARSGVSIPTIKFYLREGLLPHGELSHPNQAEYSDMHLRRLALVRALRDVGDLSISSIRRILAALEDESRPLPALMGAVVDALGDEHEVPPQPSPERAAATAEVDAFLRRMGLPVRRGAHARDQLVDALLTLRRVIHPEIPADCFEPYARAVDGLAAGEVRELGHLTSDVTDPARVLEGVVYGTVLFEPVLLALRRLAHEKAAAANVPAEPRSQARAPAR